MRKNNISEMKLLEVTWPESLYSPKPSFIPKYYSHKLLGRKDLFIGTLKLTSFGVSAPYISQ